METLTDDERGLIACAIYYPGFPPKPEYLADCERLHERGWLDRKLIAGYVTFWLSARGRTILEVGAMLDERAAAVN